MAKKLIDKMKTVTSKDEERLRKWRSEFQLDLEAHKIWYTKKREWEKFYDGDQLSAEEKMALRDRHQPEVVINRIKPRIDGIIGDFLGRRVMMRAMDRGTLDFEKAKHVTEALRYVEDHSKFDEQEEQVALDLFVGGVGWYKETLEFDFLEPEIKISYRANDDIILDRRCRKRDLSDAKRLYETVWVEVEDLIELYPSFEKEIRAAAERQENYNLAGGTEPGQNYEGDDYAKTDNVSPDTGFNFETFSDPNRQRLRLINIWERVQKQVKFAFHPMIQGSTQEVTEFNQEQMATLKQTHKGVLIFTRNKWELNSGIFIHNKILEDKLNVRPHDSMGKFPFSRAIGHIQRGEDRLPYGVVKQYIDPQKEYNKRRSKLLHKSMVNRIVAEDGAFHKNDIERVRTEVAKPDGVVIYKAGRQVQVDNDKPDNADVFLLQLAQSEIESAGIPKEFIGQEDKVMSGRAINLRQMEGQKMLRPFYAALRAARREIFTIALEEIQQYWRSEKLVKITDDPKAQNVVLNQRVPLEGGGTMIVNDLRLGKYDIKIDEDLETPNQRKETFSLLAQLGEVSLKAGEPFPLEMLIEASDLPNKQDWLQAIAAKRQHDVRMAELAAMAQAGAAQDGQDVTPT